MKNIREMSGVDIVIVNDNGGDAIKECLEGLFVSTTGRVNIIVIDQASTDGSKEYLVKKRLSHLILNSYNTGYAEGRNQGIVVGRHEWICLLNPAIRICDVEWLDKMYDLTFKQGVGLVEGVVVTDSRKLFAGLEFCLISRKCLAEVGLFDRNLDQGGDNADLTSRIEWAGWQTAYCHDVRSRYLLGEKKPVGWEWVKKYASMHDKFNDNCRRRYKENMLLNGKGGDNAVY